MRFAAATVNKNETQVSGIITLITCKYHLRMKHSNSYALRQLQYRPVTHFPAAARNPDAPAQLTRALLLVAAAPPVYDMSASQQLLPY